MESINRITNIPIVNFGIQKAGNLYTSVKESNLLFHWGFETVEYKTVSVIETLSPALNLFQTPLHKLDVILGKGLDHIEQYTPYFLFLPPQMIYWNTKEYVADHVIKPVLHGDSYKHLEKAADFAIDRLDGVIQVADQYVDKYLPENQNCANNDKNDENEEIPKVNHVVQTLKKSKRLSKKLKRRLTQRTLLEMVAIRNGGVEAVHVFIYGIELILTDPKAAWQQAQNFWIYLSGPEPGNQSRPKNFEEVIVMLAREISRKIVHLVNYGIFLMTQIPKRLCLCIISLIHHLMCSLNEIVKLVHLDTTKAKIQQKSNLFFESIVTACIKAQMYSNLLLERLAEFLSGKLEAEKISSYISRRITAATPANLSSINGLYT